MLVSACFNTRPPRVAGFHCTSSAWSQSAPTLRVGPCSLGLPWSTPPLAPRASYYLLLQPDRSARERGPAQDGIMRKVACVGGARVGWEGVWGGVLSNNGLARPACRLYRCAAHLCRLWKPRRALEPQATRAAAERRGSLRGRHCRLARI